MNSKKVLDLLVCPVTRESLNLVQNNGQNYFQSAVTKKIYDVINDIPILIPNERSEEIQAIWKRWETLQANGAYGYATLPSINTSQDEFEAQKATSVFNLSGLVLDLGCGPRSVPSAYAKSIKPLNYIGLDPIFGEVPKTFPFVHGIAEYVPFSSGVFDSVIFYSSLDHVLDVESALKEAARILKVGGHINIYMDKEQPEPSFLENLRHLTTRGFRQFVVANKDLGLLKAIQYVLKVALMKIPSGARDQFHMDFPKPSNVIKMIEEVGFGELRQIDLGNEIAFSLKKLNDIKINPSDVYENDT